MRHEISIQEYIAEQIRDAKPYPKKNFQQPPREDVLKWNIQRSNELIARALQQGNTELVQYHTEQLRQMKHELKTILNLKK